MSLIKAEHLSLRKGSAHIVDDVCWEVMPGENWVLFGPNGCGKTTLLSILSGYLSGNVGKSYLFDEAVTKQNYLDLRRRVGFVSSSFFGRYLHDEATEEVILSGKFACLGRQGHIEDSDVRRAKALSRALGIERKMRYPFDQLSRGQQQLALIARAFMGEPEVLLLDEPASGLDLMARARFLRLVRGLCAQRQVAVVYVTHHTEEITPFFTKAALMKDGAIVAQGEVEDIFTDDMLSDYFGVTAQVTWTDRHFFISLDLEEDTQDAEGGQKSWTRSKS